jgi:hypothetical protein
MDTGRLGRRRLARLLASLPLEVRSTLPDGTRILGVHAAPGLDDGPGITPHRPEKELAEVLVAWNPAIHSTTTSPRSRGVSSSDIRPSDRALRYCHYLRRAEIHALG